MRRFFAIFWVALLCSCANIVAPTGGPKDEVGPVLMESEPDNFTVNFTEKKIILLFDEYVRLKDENEILISPRLESSPSFKLLGKKLEIVLPDSLGENTTYTINFAKSLIDITEGNASRNLSFVFSTGDVLDSLSISGRVTDALDQSPAKDFLVGLYPLGTESNNTKPLYLTYTNENGKFEIRNIKKGAFEIIAFGDKNKDQLYSLGERISFNNDALHLSDSLPPLFLKSFQPISRKIISASRLIDSNTISIKTTFPFSDPKLFLGDSTELSLFIMSADSGVAYFSKINADTLEFFFSDEDIQDTVLISYKDAVGLEDSIFFIKNGSEILSDTTYQIKLNSQWRISNIERLFTVIDDKDTASVSSIEADGPFVKLKLPIKSLTKYAIYFPDSAMQNINGAFNAESIFSFKTRNFNEFGTLILDSTHQYKSELLILELLKGNEIVYREKNWKSKELRIARLEPGDYQIRFIIDENKNGRFDTGDFSRKLQAEKVLYYSEAISIKSNWELELTPQNVLQKIHWPD